MKPFYYWCCFLAIGTLLGTLVGEALSWAQRLLTWDYVYIASETRNLGPKFGFWCGSILGLMTCWNGYDGGKKWNIFNPLIFVLICSLLASITGGAAGYLIISIKPTILSETLSSPRRFAACFGLRLGVLSGMLLSVAYLVSSNWLKRQSRPQSDLGD